MNMKQGTSRLQVTSTSLRQQEKEQPRTSCHKSEDNAIFRIVGTTPAALADEGS